MLGAWFAYHKGIYGLVRCVRLQKIHQAARRARSQRVGADV